MNFLANLKASRASATRTCTRPLLSLSEPGPSRLAPQILPSRVPRSSYSPRRSFYSTTVNDFQSSLLAQYPRWVNNKAPPPPVVPAEKEDAKSEQAEVARLDGPDEGQTPPASSSAPPASSSSSSSSGDNPDGSDPPSSPPPESPAPPQTSISKQSVPEVYPQVLALPIARRPLFPGFYKAVVVRDPAVVAAIKEMMRRGQPYLGAFLLKDEQTDSDVITDVNSVHPVGVFAQITSVFTAGGKDDDKEEGLTAVLYPHRRIRITELVKGGSAKVESAESPEDSLPTPPPEPATAPGKSARVSL